MTRRSPLLFPAGLLALAVVACGARTGLDAGDFEASGGASGASATGGHAGAAHAGNVGAAGQGLSGAGGMSVPVKSDCTDVSTQFLYAIGKSGLMYSFNPATGVVKTLHNVICPSSGTPFSMAVDRKGVAFVVYSDVGSLFRVSTVTGACTVLPYQPGQHGIGDFGMGFSTDLGGPSETLFIASPGCPPAQPGCVSLQPEFASLSLSTFKLQDIAPVPGEIPGVELTGTGDGRLFGFYQDPFDDTLAHIVRIDKATGAFHQDLPLPGIVLGMGWAFGFWGGDFYLFTAPVDQGLITRVDPSTGQTTLVGTIPNGDYVVGAGVSTCAPEE